MTLRNDGVMKVSKRHATLKMEGHYKIMHVFHLSILKSNEKKYLKISLLPLSKKVSLKKFH